MSETTTDPAVLKSQYKWYMSGIVTWVAPFGLQTVLFPWLIAVQLQESADRLGIAQMTMQLPGLFLVLVGGLLADRIDPRRILVGAHLFATIPPLGVALLIYTDGLSYTWLIMYALMMGTANAFVLPARDGMLNRVAGGNLQKTVTVAMGLTFGAQLIGFVLASSADTAGAIPLLLLQVTIISLGVIATGKLHAAPVYIRTEEGTRFEQLTRGLRVAFESREMRPTMTLLFFMSLFYGGSFVVINPIMVRDIYGGAAFEMSLSYSCFVIGTVTATVAMLSVGGLKNQGLALLLGVLFGAVALGMTHFAPPFPFYLAAILGWGMCGGVAMSMGRTIVQETAPEDMRARIMAVFALCNTGGMPLGALILGICAEQLGVLNATLVCVAGVSSVGILIWLLTPLASIRVGGAPA